MLVDKDGRRRCCAKGLQGRGRRRVCGVACGPALRLTLGRDLGRRGQSAPEGQMVVFSAFAPQECNASWLLAWTLLSLVCVCVCVVVYLPKGKIMIN